MEVLQFEIIGQVAKITLNRPEVYNSFNREMALAMQAYLDECKENDEIRAIYITANGRAFSAGQDLQEITGADTPSLSTIISEHYNPIVLRLREIEKPIVCGVNGVAAGAGANIALACDITIARESASFIQAFSKIGLIPDSGGTYFLPRIVGRQKATALAMLGDKVSAKEAENLGMIYKSVADEEFEDFAFGIAVKLSKMPTKGLGLTKRAFNLSLTNDLAAQLAVEDDLQSQASQTADYAEGVGAFLEKRKPNFIGK